MFNDSSGSAPLIYKLPRRLAGGAPALEPDKAEKEASLQRASTEGQVRWQRRA
ncbi:hypothetical protein [Psychromicrobium sp. YIM B11713]|uniref:hypothetical protein n=1 Tax=Psychromicrobium sp. YIM B11713 TaxID=3145233 RepID=UPI00374E5944